MAKRKGRSLKSRKSSREGTDAPLHPQSNLIFLENIEEPWSPEPPKTAIESLLRCCGFAASKAPRSKKDQKPSEVTFGEINRKREETTERTQRKRGNKTVRKAKGTGGERTSTETVQDTGRERKRERNARAQQAGAERKRKETIQDTKRTDATKMTGSECVPTPPKTIAQTSEPLRAPLGDKNHVTVGAKSLLRARKLADKQFKLEEARVSAPRSKQSPSIDPVLDGLEDLLGDISDSWLSSSESERSITTAPTTSTNINDQKDTYCVKPLDAQNHQSFLPSPPAARLAPAADRKLLDRPKASHGYRRSWRPVQGSSSSFQVSHCGNKDEQSIHLVRRGFGREWNPLYTPVPPSEPFKGQMPTVSTSPMSLPPILPTHDGIKEAAMKDIDRLVSLPPLPPGAREKILKIKEDRRRNEDIMPTACKPQASRTVRSSYPVEQAKPSKKLNVGKLLGDLLSFEESSKPYTQSKVSADVQVEAERKEDKGRLKKKASDSVSSRRSFESQLMI